jgi:hypothetical protein
MAWTPKTSRLGNAMGRDYEAWGKMVAACLLADRPLTVDELTQWCGWATPGKAAISMKYARIDGMFERTTRDPQDAFFPTEKGKETFPIDRPHVMPEGEPIEVAPGVFVTPVPMSDVKTWGEGEQALPPSPSRRQLPPA